MTLHTINHPVQIAFDVVDFPQLTNRVYRILWASLKYQHLTDQYFKGKIAELTRQIKKKDPKEFKDFLRLVRWCDLTMFGKEERGKIIRRNYKTTVTYRCKYRGLNKKWWRYIWNLIKYNGDIELKRFINEDQD